MENFVAESSVDTTTGNRNYDHSLYGEQAMEVFRYSCNAKFTVNLLQARINLMGGGGGGWSKNWLRPLRVLCESRSQSMHVRRLVVAIPNGF